MKEGELFYNGKKVNPATFNTKGKDLRKLVGRCQSCGKGLRGEAAIPSIDGYASDLYDDKTTVVQCEDCDHDRIQDL